MDNGPLEERYLKVTYGHRKRRIMRLGTNPPGFLRMTEPL